jgi:hypothetical protein
LEVKATLAAGSRCALQVPPLGVATAIESRRPSALSSVVHRLRLSSFTGDDSYWGCHVPVSGASQLAMCGIEGKRSITSTLAHGHNRSHSLRMIMAVFLAYTVTYLPFSLTNLFDEDSALNRNVYMITSLGFWAGSCVNPLIYGIMNRQFRVAYRSVLFACVRRPLSHITLPRWDPSQSDLQHCLELSTLMLNNFEKDRACVYTCASNKTRRMLSNHSSLYLVFNFLSAVLIFLSEQVDNQKFAILFTVSASAAIWFGLT